MTGEWIVVGWNGSEFDVITNKMPWEQLMVSKAYDRMWIFGNAAPDVIELAKIRVTAKSGYVMQIPVETNGNEDMEAVGNM